MRCVTKKPPKILIEAKKIAKAPKMLLNVIILSLISTTCKIAPTKTMPEITFQAFVVLLKIHQKYLLRQKR